MPSAKAEPRAIAAEALGTAFLVMGVVGSGIMAARLTQDMALALLCNTAATAAILIVLVRVFAPVSGAHLNPAVTLSFALRGEMGWTWAAAFIAAQIAGGLAGTALAHLMFAMPAFAAGLRARTGFGQWLGEFIATFGLLLTIFGCRSRPRALASAIGLYIAAAYWFTASTSFANPAVAIARALTPSFSGIRPQDAGFFILAELAGALAATIGARFLFRLPRTEDSGAPDYSAATLT